MGCSVPFPSLITLIQSPTHEALSHTEALGHASLSLSVGGESLAPQVYTSVMPGTTLFWDDRSLETLPFVQRFPPSTVNPQPPIHLKLGCC